MFVRNTVPGLGATLTDTELPSHNAAFAAIQQDYSQIEHVRKQLDRLNIATWEQAGAKQLETIRTPDGCGWNAHASLLQLPKSDAWLCQKDGREWAIVQRLNTTGPYSGQHGHAAVLLAGNNANELVNEYIGQAKHTLRFMRGISLPRQ